MKLRIKKHKNLYISVFALLVLIFFALMNLVQWKSNKNEDIDESVSASYSISSGVGEKKEFWTKIIKEFGGQKAYQEFSTIYEGVGYTTQHVDAHLFGEILYGVEGIDGVGACDSQFSFGCYHGFMIPAIATEGTSAVFELDKKCIEKWGKDNPICQHGIGHGVLSFLGYDQLDEALTICSELTWKFEIGGCTSGVFMEFNNPTKDHVNFSVRELTDPYYPCQELDPKFQPACYFEQPLWWKNVYGGDLKRVGELCHALENEKYEAICFQGIGNEAPALGMDISRIENNCIQMPTVNGQIQCLKGASMHFNKEDAVMLCRGFEGQEKSLCTAQLQR